MHTISVIKSVCVGHGDKLRSIGSHEETMIAIDPVRLAEVITDLSSQNPGQTNQCVILRPNYNEKNDKGEVFFREWRCFHGEGFKEVRWNLESHFADSAFQTNAEQWSNGGM